MALYRQWFMVISNTVLFPSLADFIVDEPGAAPENAIGKEGAAIVYLQAAVAGRIIQHTQYGILCMIKLLEKAADVQMCELVSPAPQGKCYCRS